MKAYMLKRIFNFFKKNKPSENNVEVNKLQVDADPDIPTFEKYNTTPENPGVCVINWLDFNYNLQKDEVYKLEDSISLQAVSEDSFYMIYSSKENPFEDLAIASKSVLLPASSPLSIVNVSKNLKDVVSGDTAELA
jgi:hypothetical protein